MQVAFVAFAAVSNVHTFICVHTWSAYTRPITSYLSHYIHAQVGLVPVMAVLIVEGVPGK